MRKQFNLSILLLLAILAGAQVVNAVEVGNEITFVVNKVSASYGYTEGGSTKSASTDRFKIGAEKFPVGTEFIAKVTAKGAGSVNYELRLTNGTSITNTSTNGLAWGLGLLVYTMFPLFAIGLATAPDLTTGMSIGDWIYFVPPGVSWSSLAEDFGNTTYWQEMEDDINADNSGHLDLAGSVTFTNNNETVSFVFTMTGSMVNSTQEINLSQISHKMRIDCHVTAGYLLGYLLESAVSGQTEGKSASITVSLEVVKKGYVISTAAAAPGFEQLFAVLGFGAVVVLRKRNH